MRRYVCVLSTDNYLEGVLVLNENLKRLKSRYKLLCIINEKISNKTKEILDFFKIEYRIIKCIEFNNEKNDNPYWKYTFDKLNVFLLKEYEKVVYLDSDLLILENIDKLFDKETIAMPKDIPFNRESYNSSVMVIKPNMKDYNNLVNMAYESNLNGEKISDQYIINRYFKKINTLDKTYNLAKILMEDERYSIENNINGEKEEWLRVLNYKENREEPKIVHYIGTLKPFMVKEMFSDKYAYQYFFYLSIIREKLKNFYLLEDNETISIIIPLYNKEKYIKKCLNSIVNQTYRKLDIIIVDNCSTDNSLAICEEFQKKDYRIRIYKNNKNRGVSYSRNLGLRLAFGQYISFIDADDYIDNEMYEKLYCMCKKYDLDFCQCAINDNEKRKFDLYDDIYCMQNTESVIFNYLCERISPFVYDKLYKKEIIEDVYFNEDYKKNEDVLFIVKILFKSKKAALINDVLYFYSYMRTGKLKNDFNFKDDINLFSILDYIEKKILQNYPTILFKFVNNKLAFIRYFIHKLTEKYSINEMNENKDIKEFFCETKKYVYFILDKYEIYGDFCNEIITMIDNISDKN